MSSLFLQNPLGLWALSALPVLVAIHFFRRQARRVQVSTLFLIQEPERVTQKGARWTKFEQSLPFWLQCFIVLLAVLWISEPQIVAENQRIRVALVMDTSASMGAYRVEAKQGVTDLLDGLPCLIPKEIGLFASNPEGGALGFAADRRSALSVLVEDWHPNRANHQPVDMLEVARQWVGRDGQVIFVTDRIDVEMAEGVDRLAVGVPLGNVGFVSLEVEPSGVWEALVKNIGSEPTERTWWMEVDGVETTRRDISIPAGGTMRLRGQIPMEAEMPRIHLSEDVLSIDNVCPVALPLRDPISTRLSLSEPNLEVWKSIAVGFPELVAAETHNALLWITDVAVAENARARVQFLPPLDSALSSDWSRGPFIREAHALTQDLSLGGLIARFGASTLEVDGTATSLFRMGADSVVLHSPYPKSLLQFNWSLAFSNMDQHPGSLLLLVRFLDQLAIDHGLVRSGNYLTGESLPLARTTERPVIEVSSVDGSHLSKDASPYRAPSLPAHFVVRSGNEVVHSGASQFFEIPELDLSQSASSPSFPIDWQSQVETEAGNLAGWRLLPGVILGLLLLSWWLIHRDPN